MENFTETQEPGSDRLFLKTKEAIEELKVAQPLGKQRVQEKVYQFLREMFKTPGGVERVYGLVPNLVAAGIFSGGGWEHEDRLLPSLIRGSLLTNGIFPTVEALSELRMLAIAKGRLSSETLKSEDAERFLIEALALNLDILFDHKTEESRSSGYQYQLSRNLMMFISKNVDLSALFQTFLAEIKALTHQRPIVTEPIRKIVYSGLELVTDRANPEDIKEFNLYYNACFRPTAEVEANQDLGNYRSRLKNMTSEALQEEAKQFGYYLKSTGLSSPHMAVFLRVAVKQDPDCIPLALALENRGQLEYSEHNDFVKQIIRACVRPSTYEFIYGLAGFLERNLMSRKEVVTGIQKLVESDIREDVRVALLKRRRFSDDMTPNAVLICGLIGVFGQPLGIGQGNNPTCQAARGISLWSQHDPAYLIEALLSVVRDGNLHVPFQGQMLESQKLVQFGVDRYKDTSVDPVSQVLAPHLDVIYAEILRRCVGRGADPHKWANPALYGRWINIGFDSVLDLTQTAVQNYENFVRRFYATHHPEYCDSPVLTYANPVGLFITNTHGDLIGLHAVSVERVGSTEDGEYRVYFFNPNNEGRQDWGQGVKPTVYGNGEKYGESSLAFGDFVSRLYAFHFNPYEEGDGFAVPKDVIGAVIDKAKKSWGRSYIWI